jgi:hypothetical protein
MNRTAFSFISLLWCFGCVGGIPPAPEPPVTPPPPENQEETYIEVTSHIYRYAPVYLTTQEFRASFRLEAPRAMSKPGKIVLHNDILYVNEKLEGVHIIDNANPAEPVNLAFLKIIGNIDLAIKDNLLYADSWMDLVVIDVSSIRDDLLGISLVKRIENVFPRDFTALYYDFTQAFRSKYGQWEEGPGGTFHDFISEPGHENDIVTGFRFVNKETHTEKHPANVRFEEGRSSTGIAGSMARFAIAGEYLYTVDKENLHVFSIRGPAPEYLGKAPVSRQKTEIETIFSYKGYLYIGSISGLFIYEITTNPQQPAFVSTLPHQIRRDPVVVQNQFAYSTLRNGQLLVIDISDITKPLLVKTVNFSSATGLAVEGNYLFVCQGEWGFSIFDVHDPRDLKSIFNYAQYILKNQREPFFPGRSFCYDVIVSKGTAIFTTENGIYQFDVSNPKKPLPKSKLQIMKKPDTGFVDEGN